MQLVKAFSIKKINLSGPRAWRILALLVLFAGHLQVQGQQLPQFTQFTELRSYINPAATATDGLRFGLAGRHQWTGLRNQAGDPAGFRSYMAYTGIPMLKVNSGVGLLLLADFADYETTYYARLNGAHHIKAARDLTLSIGASFDFIDKTFDYSQFANDQGTPPWLPFPGRQRASGFDLGTGILLSHQNGSWLGISANNLLQTTLRYSAFNYRYARQFQIMAGTSIPLIDARNRSLALLPALLVHSTQSLSPQVTAQALLLFNDNFYFGAMYRYQDAIGAVAGLMISNFRVGFSYDYTTSRLRQAGSMGSPEVTVSWVRPPVRRTRWEGRCY